MSSIFSEIDSDVKVLISQFQGSLSLYYNNNTHRVGFLDREIYDAYPELARSPAVPDHPLSIEDLKKRKIYLILKHAKWISPVLLKGTELRSAGGGAAMC
ncbi:hypothetical protein [carnivorous sponge associated iridovirus]|jgi:hypothetical protein|nr:hypothetical protein [carnivorous sponge associated iridovirus]